MISSAIQSSLVMIPIILIVHLLLKHILIDKEIEKGEQVQKKTEEDKEKEKEKEESNREDRKGKTKKNEHVEEGEENEEIYLKKRLAQLNAAKAAKKTTSSSPSPPVKFQPRRPARDPTSTRIAPNSDDVYSFVLQGEPPQKNENSLESKPNSFFTEPHIPQDDSEMESFMNGATKDGKKGETDMQEMQEMYADPIFVKKNPLDTTLFNNIGAANSDTDETSLDEIFRQTQVPT